MCTESSRCVTLDVGGTEFRTRISTLSRGDTFFAALLRHAADTSAPLFVDRDPRVFRHVLNWLRGSPILPASARDLTELRAEAEYYCMPDLVDTIDRLGKVQSESDMLRSELVLIKRELMSLTAVVAHGRRGR